MVPKPKNTTETKAKGLILDFALSNYFRCFWKGPWAPRQVQMVETSYRYVLKIKVIVAWNNMKSNEI